MLQLHPVEQRSRGHLAIARRCGAWTCRARRGAVVRHALLSRCAATSCEFVWQMGTAPEIHLVGRLALERAASRSACLTRSKRSDRSRHEGLMERWITRCGAVGLIVCAACILPEVKSTGTRDAGARDATAANPNATPATGSVTHVSSTSGGRTALEPAAAGASEQMVPPAAMGGSSGIAAGTPAVASSMDSSVPEAGPATDSTQQACATPCGTECPDLMSDARHCGSCDVACARTCLGGECQPHPIQVVPPGTLNYSRFVVSKDALYWTDTQSRAVKKAALADGVVKTLAINDIATSDVIGVDAHDVYYYAGGLRSVPIEGGEPKQFAQPNSRPVSYSMDSKWIYADYPDIYRAPHGSSDFTLMLADSNVGIYAAYEGTVYFHRGYDAWKISEPGDTPIQLQTSLPSVLSQTVDSHYLYLFFDTGVVRKADVNSGVWSDLVNTHEHQPQLVSDGNYLYWPRTRLGVQRIPIEGGDVVTMATGQAPVCLDVDDTSVYWLNQDGAVMKTPK